MNNLIINKYDECNMHIKFTRKLNYCMLRTYNDNYDICEDSWFNR